MSLKFSLNGDYLQLNNLSESRDVTYIHDPFLGCSYLKLDVVQITVQNTFRWFGGVKSEMKAVHMEILQILVRYFYTFMLVNYW